MNCSWIQYQKWRQKISTLENTTKTVQKDIQLNNEKMNQLKTDIAGLSTSKQVQQIQDSFNELMVIMKMDTKKKNQCN
jgi:uncharacterized protein YoxC